MASHDSTWRSSITETPELASTTVAVQWVETAQHVDEIAVVLAHAVEHVDRPLRDPSTARNLANLRFSLEDEKAADAGPAGADGNQSD